jgi:hypothetical protein
VLRDLETVETGRQFPDFMIMFCALVNRKYLLSSRNCWHIFVVLGKILLLLYAVYSNPVLNFGYITLVKLSL